MNIVGHTTPETPYFVKIISQEIIFCSLIIIKVTFQKIYLCIGVVGQIGRDRGTESLIIVKTQAEGEIREIAHFMEEFTVCFVSITVSIIHKSDHSCIL